MRASGNNVIRIVSTGFIVLVLFSLLVFWLRLWCSFSLLENAPYNINKVTITPSHLVPAAIENDPNVSQHSNVTASFSGPNWKTLGILNYFSHVVPEGEGSNIYRFYVNHRSGEWSGVYFDNKTGLVVYESNTTESMSDGTKHKKEIKLYAGPNGISEVRDKKLGKFSSPLADMTHSRNKETLYDKNLRRFFSIDFNEEKVIKGPQLSKNIHKPVQIGALGKAPFIMHLDISSPVINDSNTNTEVGTYRGIQFRDLSKDIHKYSWNGYLPVLDETNRIYLIDRESLEFTGIAGSLPVPDTLFETKQQPGAKDLLSYLVYPVTFGPDRKYMGMFAASVNREGTAIAVSVFDPNGYPTASRQSKLTQSDESSSKAIYFGVPWGPVLTICKYALENLQPPVLSITSYLTANSFDAGSGHTGLFILPDSFVAMLARYNWDNFITRFAYAIFLILPSIILSILLARIISKDASKIGLSDRERLLWIIGTIAFGITAYITYRLTRPKFTLVTCQNCGKPRRPDMDRCHHCKSVWQVPELTPPSWRVIGSS